MMKKIMALLLCLLLLCGTTAVADMDNTVLTGVEGAQVWHLNDIDLVVRTVSMPFTCTSDSEDWELDVFVDYVELAEEGVTAMRLTVSTSGGNMLFADELRITVGKKTWSFTPSCNVSEYDMLYMEDYYVCLGEEGLAVIQALVKGKGTATVKLIGDMTLTGKASIPAKEIRSLYELYKDAGGLTQDLGAVDARWPVTQVK